MNKDRLINHNQCVYADIPAIMADSQVVLNVQPLFTEVPHDRIFNAMANGAAVLTDTCSYIEENYKDYVMLFDKGNPKESIENLKGLLSDTDKLYQMAEKLNQAAESETWQDRCQKIMEFINKIF